MICAKAQIDASENDAMSSVRLETNALVPMSGEAIALDFYYIIVAIISDTGQQKKRRRSLS